MITSLLIHYLGDGEIPIYDTEVGGQYFTLNYNDEDPPTSHWEPRRAHSARVIIPLSVDLTVRYLAGLLPDWLLGLDDLGVDGSLIFSIRSLCDLPPFGLWTCSGLGFLPGNNCRNAYPLDGSRAEDLILHVCREPRGENFNGLHPVIRAMFADRIANREALELERQQETEALAKSRVLLEQFLTDDQQEELTMTGAFHVRGEDRRIYRVRKGYAHNVDLIENGEPTRRYCIISKESMPIYDQMLGQKLLLEKNVGEFLRLANFTDRAPAQGAWLAHQADL